MSEVPPLSRSGRSFLLRLLGAGVVVLVVVATSVAAVVNEGAGDIEDALRSSQDANVDVDGSARGEPQTLLLVGDDHRFGSGEGNRTRADTMLLVRLNPEEKVTTMLSLPRDLLISPPGSPNVKLNSAFTKGPQNLMRKLRQLLSRPGERFRINHYVSIRFTAFSKAVNELGCLYADIDWTYFNDNNPPRGSREPYAAIDVPSGYQRLCGEDALSFVRYRHGDTDKVREARQQTFLADARAQVSTGKLISDRDGLLEAIAPLLTTDPQLKKRRELLRLANLALSVSGGATKRIELDVTDAGDNSSYRASPAALRRAARQFLHPGTVGEPGVTSSSSSSSAGRSSRRSTKARRAARRRARATPATIQASDAGPQLGRQLQQKLAELPVFAPTRARAGATYDEAATHAYDIASPGGKLYPWPAYRIVVDLPGLGQRYGIQGTTWRDPPLLKLPGSKERLGGRTFTVQYDGRRIRRIVLRTSRGTYWVANSLTAQLTNAEMRAIARSLAPVR